MDGVSNPLKRFALTHYHADHIAGLPGFLLTLGNSGRTDPLTILGPPPLAYVISALTVIAPQLPYEINLTELPEQEESRFQLGEYRIRALPMDHMIPCMAYSFEIDRAGKFDSARAAEQGIPKEYWSALQKGNETEHEGRRLLPEMVVGPPRKGLKVTYCTDSRPKEELIDFSRESDLLICEGMYGDDELLEKAVERKHMIFSEAADHRKTEPFKGAVADAFQPFSQGAFRLYRRRKKFIPEYGHRRGSDDETAEFQRLISIAACLPGVFSWKSLALQILGS